MSAPPDKFHTGWRKLADELKLDILGYVVPSGLILTANSLRGTTKDRKCVSLQKHIMPVLACPETAPIALELLYKRNTLKFVVGNQPMLLPPKHVRKHVRSWHAGLRVEHVESPQFNILAQNLVGFPRMDNITLVISGLFNNPEMGTDATIHRLIAMNTFVLNTKELLVTCNCFDERPIACNAMDQVIFKRFAIVGKTEDVKLEHDYVMFPYTWGQIRDVITGVIHSWPYNGLYPDGYTHHGKMRIWC
ncbi:hypothetical protein DE146DRAFT_757838 [Phaeosphaeria sp. MPI-PUGE-AT-0046c]|nr:hypothetical protein DE146DRAFT_757838 [Phaeosphaeria sp. MPI-PUGE-AT-0046c]